MYSIEDRCGSDMVTGQINIVVQTDGLSSSCMVFSLYSCPPNSSSGRNKSIWQKIKEDPIKSVVLDPIKSAVLDLIKSAVLDLIKSVVLDPIKSVVLDPIKSAVLDPIKSVI